MMNIYNVYYKCYLIKNFILDNLRKNIKNFYDNKLYKINKNK